MSCQTNANRERHATSGQQSYRRPLEYAAFLVICKLCLSHASASLVLVGAGDVANGRVLWPEGRGNATRVCNYTCGRSQVNMVYIGWATHVPQGRRQRAAKVKTLAIFKCRLSSDRTLQLACVKLKSLVIANHHVAVKTNQALHTPPITLEKFLQQDALAALTGPTGESLYG